MMGATREALLDQKRIMEILMIKQPQIGEYSDFVFLTQSGSPHTRENVREQLQTIIEEYNKFHPEEPPLPRINTHSLRHTFATILCRATADLKAIESILGHADIS